MTPREKLSVWMVLVSWQSVCGIFPQSSRPRPKNNRAFSDFMGDVEGGRIEKVPLRQETPHLQGREEQFHTRLPRSTRASPTSSMHSKSYYRKERRKVPGRSAVSGAPILC